MVGRVLSSVKYDETESTALEELIKHISDQAISTSTVLTRLKIKLERLNQTFGGSGKAEITPFPRKVRDLSKYFSINFGETENNSSFPMEYHGMGTRSWASIISMQTFAELIADSHTIDSKQFFPILAAEEPEAHLHPNAQKTLYKQLKESKGQVIISTHSPYVAAMAKQSELRYLKRDTDCIVVKQLSPKNDNETDKEFDEKCRKLNREVIHSKGEILFSKAIVLCEGETEEQALPLLFEKYFGSEAFVMGVSFVGVGGSGEKYLPFLTFGKDFNIPVFIFSDGEPKTVKELKESYEKIHGLTDIQSSPMITILDGTDFEGYLISFGFESIIESVIRQEEGEQYIEYWIGKNQGQRDQKKLDIRHCLSCQQPIFEYTLQNYTEADGYKKALNKIVDKRRKTRYAPLIAEKLCELEKEQLPPKIIEFFQKLENGGII